MKTNDVKATPSSFTTVRANNGMVTIVIAPPTKTLSVENWMPQPETKTDKIMQTLSSPAVSSTSAMSPDMLSSSATDSDAEWQPSNGKIKRPKSKYERKVQPRRPKAEPYPKNKIEKKKLKTKLLLGSIERKRNRNKIQ